MPRDNFCILKFLKFYILKCISKTEVKREKANYFLRDSKKKKKKKWKIALYCNKKIIYIYKGLTSKQNDDL